MVLWFCDSDLQCIDEILYYWTDVWNNKKHYDIIFISSMNGGQAVVYNTSSTLAKKPANIWLKWSGSYSRVSGRSDPAVMWVNALALLCFSGTMRWSV